MYSCRVGIDLPTIEVRFSDLFVEAECEVVYGKPIPTLWNAIANRLSVSVIQYCYNLSFDFQFLLRLDPYYCDFDRDSCVRSKQRK